MGYAKSSLMICYLVFFDEQAVLFTFVVLSPSFIKVKTKNKAVLMCVDDAFYKTTSSHNLTFSESTKELTISEEKPYRSGLFSKSKYLQDRYCPSGAYPRILPS